MRRAAVVLAALAVLAGCGGGGDEPGPAPQATSTPVDVSIPTPPPSDVKEFEGQNLTEKDTTRFARTVTKALRSGNERAFVALFDPKKPELISRMRTWLRNVRAVPMDKRNVYVVGARTNIDSSGRGLLTADVGFEHQIRGVDPEPIAEWYRYGFRKRGGKLLVASVGGAPPDESSGAKFSRYYRHPWDDPPMAVVSRPRAIVLGPVADRAAMTRLAGAADGAMRQVTARLGALGLPHGHRGARYMFAVQSPGVAELADYFGGRVDPTEANFQGFTTPVYETDHQTGEIFTTRPSTSRIVLARSLLSNPDPAVLRHEIVHALLFSVNNARDVPTWAVEGAAVYFSDISAGERAFRSAAGRRGLAGAKTMPSDAKFYERQRRRGGPQVRHGLPRDRVPGRPLRRAQRAARTHAPLPQRDLRERVHTDEEQGAVRRPPAEVGGMRRATVLIAVLALLTGCGGSDEPVKPNGAPAAKATATPDPDTLVRWPRFWAVREGAETGAEDNLDTRYMAGYDENAVVYNGQDVIRVLAKADGKQTGRVLLPRDRFVCATSPRREIDAGVAVFGVGTIGRDEGTCDQVIGVSTSTGKKVWSSAKYPSAVCCGVIDPLLDAREGVTMFSTGTTLVAFDTATGKQLWRRSAAKLGKARDGYARRRCEIAAALAADRPVIIVYPSACAIRLRPDGDRRARSQDRQAALDRGGPPRSRAVLAVQRGAASARRAVPRPDREPRTGRGTGAGGVRGIRGREHLALQDAGERRGR